MDACPANFVGKCSGRSAGAEVRLLFAFAAGDLVGQGGWEASPIASNSPQVDPDQVIAGSVTEAAAYQEDLLDAFDLAEPLTMTVVFETDADLTTRGYLDLVLGDIGATAVVLQIDTNTSVALVNQVGLLLDDTLGGMVDVDNVPCIWSVSHTIQVIWSGASAVVKLDGATVSSGAIAALATLSNGDFALYFNETAAAPTTRLTSVTFSGSPA